MKQFSFQLILTWRSPSAKCPLRSDQLANWAKCICNTVSYFDRTARTRRPQRQWRVPVAHCRQCTDSPRPPLCRATIVRLSRQCLCTLLILIGAKRLMANLQLSRRLWCWPIHRQQWACSNHHFLDRTTIGMRAMFVNLFDDRTMRLTIFSMSFQWIKHLFYFFGRLIFKCNMRYLNLLLYFFLYIYLIILINCILVKVNVMCVCNFMSVGFVCFLFCIGTYGFHGRNRGEFKGAQCACV